MFDTRFVNRLESKKNNRTARERMSDVHILCGTARKEAQKKRMKLKRNKINKS